MDNNKNIIEFDTQSDGIDLKKIVKSLVSSWPSLLLIFLFWATIGILLLKFVQPTFQIKSTILIEEPQRISDPQRYTIGPQNFNAPDDEYFVNEKIRIKRQPLVRRTLDSLNLNVSYFKHSVGMREIYADRPFTIWLSKEWNESRMDLPFDNLFKVELIDEESFRLKFNGRSKLSDELISINDSFLYGQKIDVADVSIRINKEDSYTGNDKEFSFQIHDQKTILQNVLDNLEVKTEELSATVLGMYITGRAPQKQIDLLNTLGQLYIDEHLEEKKRNYRSISDYIGKELSELSAQLEETEKELENFKSRNEINNLSREAGVLLSQTTKLENEKVNLIVRQKYFDYLIDFLSNSENYEKLISPLAFKINDPILVDLTNELVNLQMEKNHMVVQGNQSNPSFALINSKITSIKTSILQSVDGFQTSNNIRFEDLNSRLEQLGRDSRNIPKAEREYIKIERLMKLQEASYLNLLEKKTDTDIAMGSVVSDFQILEPAYLVDTDPIFPNLIVVLALVFLLSILSIVAYLVYKTLYKTEIKDLSNLQALSSGLPIDGTIDHTNLNSAQLLDQYDHSFTAENFNALALKVQEQLDGKKKTIFVCSHGLKEGRSFVTSGLAVSLARNGQKVVVIDLDTKHPKQAKEFGAECELTLLDHIIDGGTISKYLYPTFNENIRLMNGGNVDHILNSFEASEFKEVITKIKKTTDHIIIDSGPLGLSSNYSTIMRICDRNLIVFRRNKSRSEDWDSIKKMLPLGITEKVGLVLNGDIEKYSDLSRSEKKYYQNKKRSLIYRLKYAINKI